MGKLGLGSFGMALTVSDTYLDEAERLGYSAIWLPGDQIDSPGRLADVIGATTAAMPDRRSSPWRAHPLRFLSGLPGYAASLPG